MPLQLTKAGVPSCNILSRASLGGSLRSPPRYGAMVE